MKHKKKLQNKIEDEQKGFDTYPSKLDKQKQKDKEDRGEYGEEQEKHDQPIEVEAIHKEYFKKELISPFEDSNLF